MMEEDSKLDESKPKYININKQLKGPPQTESKE